MKFAKTFTGIALLLALAATCLGAQVPAPASAIVEKTFPTLKIGTDTYTNVTITSANKTYVLFMHSAGMMTVKVAEMSDEEKKLLGYTVKPALLGTNAASTAKAVVAATVKKIETPQIKEIEQRIKASTVSANSLEKLAASTNATMIIAGISAAFLLIYLFACYCSKLICIKAGTEPGALIWIPVLQMIPLLRAAKMSPLWIIGMAVPVLNIIGQILWCVRISHARGKGFWTIIGLILPVTNIIAYLYLAFSDGEEDDDDDGVKVRLSTAPAGS